MREYIDYGEIEGMLIFFELMEIPVWVDDGKGGKWICFGEKNTIQHHT